MPASRQVINPDPSVTFKQLILADLGERGFEIRSTEGTPIAYLKLIGAVDLQDDFLIQQITDWRRRYKHCFLSEFEPTCIRTKNWMQEAVVNNPARALFRILSPDGALMGHVGAIHRKTYIEYDYYILGVKPEVKNFALCVASQFLLWLLDLTKLELISGNVRSDNLHGLDFHRRTGFSVYQQVPLLRIDTGQGEVRFEEQRGMTQSDYYLVEIRATAADLLAADFRQLKPGD